MSDQADSLRQLVRRFHATDAVRVQAASIVVVCGSRSQVGTTTVAANLALGLVRAGQATILVEADRQAPRLAELWQMTLKGTIGEALSECRTIRELLVSGPAGLQVVCADPHQPPAEVTRDAVARVASELRRLGTLAQSVVVDAGAVGQQEARWWWEQADLALCVTTDEAVSVMDGYAGIKLAAQAGEKMPRLALVVNRADASATADVERRVGAACRKFLGLQPLAALPLAESPEESPGQLALTSERAASTPLSEDVEALTVRVGSWLAPPATKADTFCKAA